MDSYVFRNSVLCLLGIKFDSRNGFSFKIIFQPQFLFVSCHLASKVHEKKIVQPTSQLLFARRSCLQALQGYSPDSSVIKLFEEYTMLHMTSQLDPRGSRIITASIFVGILGDSTNVKDRYLSAHTTLKPSYQNKLK